MRRTILSIGSVLFLGASAFAQTTSAPQPVRPANDVLLVLPILPPADRSYGWIGHALQQDIVSDLIQTTHAQVIAPASAGPATDERSALEAGRLAGAGFVLYGQSQVSGGQMRISGQLLDVSSGRSIGSINAAAPTDNLFPLEDSIAAQAARALPAPLGTPAPQQTPANPPNPGTPYQTLDTSGPQTTPYAVQEAPQVGPSPYYSYTEAAPPAYYTYNTYYYPYYWGYPYYAYGGPYWWGGVGIGFGGYYGGWYGHHHGWYGPRGYAYRGGHYYGGAHYGGAAHGFGGAHAGGLGGHAGGGGGRGR